MTEELVRDGIALCAERIVLLLRYGSICPNTSFNFGNARLCLRSDMT